MLCNDMGGGREVLGEQGCACEGDNVFASPTKHCCGGKQPIRNDRSTARSENTEHPTQFLRDSRKLARMYMERAEKPTEQSS